MHAHHPRNGPLQMNSSRAQFGNVSHNVLAQVWDDLVGLVPDQENSTPPAKHRVAGL
jgi:hypothetical protein